MRTVLYLVAVLLVGVLVLLVAAGDPDTADTTARGTVGEPVGRSWSFITGVDEPGEPLDQPIPVPDREWQGWDHYGTGRCAWMPSGLLGPLDPIQPPRPTATGCAVSLNRGGTVHVTWGTPQKRLQWYGTSTDSRREVVGDLITVAGLEARTYRPFLLAVLTLGFCRVDVNTRSLSGLSVLVWNPPAAANACDVAEAVATLVVRALVPAAGGTPWADTPQQPTPQALEGRTTCELLIAGIHPLTELATSYPAITGVDTVQRCELAPSDSTVRVSMTSTSGTEDRPDAQGATVGQLGSLSAWQTDTADTCTLTTEVLPGHLLTVSYHDSGPAAARCGVSELISANTVQTLLDRSTS